MYRNSCLYKNMWKLLNDQLMLLYVLTSLGYKAMGKKVFCKQTADLLLKILASISFQTFFRLTRASAKISLSMLYHI